MKSLRCWQTLWRKKACLEFEGEGILLDEHLPIEPIVIRTIDVIEGSLKIPVVGATAIHLTSLLNL